MTIAPGVPHRVLEQLRICLALTEVYEEPAWVGTRWRVRSKTFAHVLTITDGTPRAHARAAGIDGPATVLTFRAPRTDWTEVAELLTASFCLLAPRKLVAQVARP